MSCPELEQLEQFVAGMLHAELQQDVQAHLASCSGCQAQLSQLRDNQRVLEQLDRIQPQSAAEPLEVERRSPVSIEGYEMVRELHRGGQGVVYEALQRSTKRKVAVKILLAGPYASKSARRRFEREIELVAQLKHPNIISIFESGSTKEGLPYFAMDYIRGSPLHDFVREKKLALEETLKLFSTVCKAVQYAHQRGVIHRDVKPSNIIVDAAGNPKVLDFGLAKLLAGPIETIVSVTQDVLGTLPYMSPEQAGGSPEEVDTRTDVYSLGVILYELLTGHYPYPVIGKMSEILQHITETPPTPPTRKWTSDRGVVKRSKRRLRTGPCPIDGDVEAMVLRALEKEPSRRYQTANAFSDDIERYLTDKPILARAPSAIYQLRKLVMRHKVPVAFVVVLFLVITGFGISMTALYRGANLEAMKANQVQRFLQEMLASISPAVARGRDTTILRELLDNAATKVATELIEHPVVEAEIRYTIGTSYMRLGQLEPAEEHLQEAVKLYNSCGSRDEGMVRGNSMLAELLRLKGDYINAESLARKALDTARRALGAEHPATLKSMNALSNVLWSRQKYVDALALDRETLATRRLALGPDHPATLNSMHNLATSLQMVGQTVEAERMLRETWSIRSRLLGDTHPKTLKSVSNLSSVLHYQGRLAEAEELDQKTLPIARTVFGEEHPDTRLVMYNLGTVLQELGRYEEAEALFRRTLELRRRDLGDEHRRTVEAWDKLVEVLCAQGRQDDARPFTTERISRQRSAAAQPGASYRAFDALARTLLTCEPVDLREPAEALRAARKAVELTDSKDPNVLDTLALGYELSGDLDKAIATQEQAVSLLTTTGSSLSIDKQERLIDQLDRLTDYLWKNGDHDQARHRVGELLAHLKQRAQHTDTSAYLLNKYASTLLTCYPEDMRDPETALRFAMAAVEMAGAPVPRFLDTLALSYQMTGDVDKAAKTWQQALTSLRQGDLLRTRVLDRLTRLHESCGKPEKAAQYRAMLPETEKQARPPQP